ncbi:MAG: nitroreductase family protein [Eubacteriales bacterium]
MDLKTAMQKRHSVRAYTDKPIEKEVLNELIKVIEECNKEGDLHIQLVTDEPRAFDCFMAHYGKFSGVKNYVALIGKKCDNLDEKIGYYGEKIVLTAQSLGLNSCWVAMSYKKIATAFTLNENEKICCVIAIGYGATEGVPHKSKTMENVFSLNDPPAWFINGIRATLLAPTAMNRQNFKFTMEDGKVLCKTGAGPCSKIDLGIVKYHFELGAGKENFEWLK